MLCRALLVLALSAPCLAGSARAEEVTHQVVAPEARAAAGEKAKATVTITGKNGWHVNEEAPISVKLAPSAGVTVDKPKLSKGDLAVRTKDEARFDVGFLAVEPGRKTIAAEASFVMCQASACKPVKEKVTLAVEVAAPKKK
jgi:DsbC/DsbD-like thiol-disulfide interchange protein